MEAATAAAEFLLKLDAGDYSAAYEQLAPETKALASLDLWVTTLPKFGSVTNREFTGITAYNTERGTLHAIDFRSTTAVAERECGYIIVDVKGAIIRLESAKVPEGLPRSVATELLKGLPGCKDLIPTN
jgi:hypothetical protein